MTNASDEIDFGWLFEEFVEVRLRPTPDGMLELHYKTTPERGAVIMEALQRVAAQLPRAPGTTDEQHDYDAMIELSRRHRVQKAALTARNAPTDLASQAMATIRDADERARVIRRGRTPCSSGDSGDPKLRAATEMILAMPVDDRLRQIEAESNFFSSIRRIDS